MRIIERHPAAIAVLASIAMLLGLSTEYAIKVLPIFAGNFAIGHGNCTMLLPPRKYASNHRHSRWIFDQDRATNRVRAIAEPIAERRNDVMFVDIVLTSKAPSISPPQFAAHLGLALLNEREDYFQTDASKEDASRARSESKLNEFVSARPDLKITHEAFVFEPVGWIKLYSFIGSIVYRTPSDRTFVFVSRRRMSDEGIGKISQGGIGIFYGLEEGRDAQICDVR